MLLYEIIVGGLLLSGLITWHFEKKEIEEELKYDIDTKD